MNAKSTISLLVITVAGWAGNAQANGGNGLEQQDTAIFKSLIAPFGVVTFSLLLTTVILGLKMASNRAAIFPWHRRIAFSTLFLSLCHATLVIIFH